MRYELKRWGRSLSSIKLLIEKCNWVILLLDQLEELRQLSVPEFNFRNIVKTHLKKLLRQQSDYWRQRCTIRWVKLGGENTKFFHAKATERYRCNAITSILDENGITLDDHQGKANAFWYCFKNRMGVSNDTNESVDLRSFLPHVEGLAQLADEFSIDEIEGIVKHLKPDRAPGPDGFTGLFIKKCWHILKEDFVQMCSEFHRGQLSLENINGSYITLVPKKLIPETVNDFRPISLTNTCLKFLTKLVANRFQKIICKCIHDNQYGFIKSRTIQDCLAWCFEYLFQCKQSKRKVVAIKIDFEKAFDTIEHKAILEVLKCKGFPPLVIKWVQEVLTSGSSSVLLNGVPGKKFFCRRGVRQGDPLSPILYVLGGDLLQSIINQAFDDGKLQLPIPVEGKFPVVQYADDTLVILPADPVQLQTFKELLDLFASITGLKINYNKSNLIPINLSSEEASAMAQIFSCQIASMPFTYLGLPMGTTKPSMKDFAPLIDRVERRLNATVSFLSYGDSLVLVNSVLSSLPTYYMCTLVIPKGVIKIIDKARRRCLWRKDKHKERVNSLAAWDMVCKPKDKGGLGIINLQVQNKALLLKFLNKYYNNADLPWVKLVRNAYFYNTVTHAVTMSGSFWWRGVISNVDDWRAITKCIPGDGSSILLWDDFWSDKFLSQKFARLFSFAKDKLSSIKEILAHNQLSDAFHLPLSVEAFQEFTELQSVLANVVLNDSADEWVCDLSKDGYTPRGFYKLFFAGFPKDIPSSWIWKSKCMSKHKFFAWLVLHDRLNTKDMLIRRNWKVTENNSCVLCCQDKLEDWLHLFFHCQFSGRVWNYLQIVWETDSVLNNLRQARKEFHGPCFSEVVILACWNIWKQRNGLIFKDILPTFRGWKSGFVHDITLLLHRVKRSVHPLLSSWIDNLP